MNTIEILLGQKETSTALELERRLEGLGYLVKGIAASGLEILNLAERIRPSLALIDMNIEGELSSIETAASLARNLAIPSIYLIDRAYIHNVNGAQLIDAVGYLIKPAADDELRTCIECGLSVQRNREKLRLNLDWHRIRLDASLACIDSLQAEAKSCNSSAFLMECSMATTERESGQEGPSL